jgi:hypothetical protein
MFSFLQVSGWRNLSSFEKKVNYERHEDSHDILAHIEISVDMSEMHKVPADAAELIDILKVRHELLLVERPDKRPREFKLAIKTQHQFCFAGVFTNLLQQALERKNDLDRFNS